MATILQNPRDHVKATFGVTRSTLDGRSALTLIARIPGAPLSPFRFYYDARSFAFLGARGRDFKETLEKHQFVVLKQVPRKLVRALSHGKETSTIPQSAAY